MNNYCTNHDARYDPSTGCWLEKTCNFSQNGCEFCENRPETLTAEYCKSCEGYEDCDERMS